MSVFGSIKDATNPFTRLVLTTTHEDKNLGVAYYQQEEVKEAAFQSDYGCDSIHKALVSRLDHKNPVVQLKSLFLMRAMMLEGPASFNAKMSGTSGRILHFVHADTFKGSVEEKCKELAQAIHQAINGDSGALARSLRDMGHSGGPTAPTSDTGSTQKYKSDFKLQQERELKAFRKKKEEEKRNAAIVVNDKLYESFDGTLPPAKLVLQAVESPKKKYAAEELNNFVEASIQNGNVQEVAHQLDLVLKDGKHNLTVRYKALTIIDAIITAPLSDAVIYFKQKQVGVQRHLTIDRADNPTKSQMTQQLAQSILQRLDSTPMPQTGLSSENASPTLAQTKARGSSFINQQSPVMTAPQPQAQPQPQAGGMDDMFSNLNVKSKGAQPAQSAPQQSGWGQPAQNQNSGWGNSWSAQPTGFDNNAWSQPQQQSAGGFNSSTSAPPAVPNNSLAFSSSMTNVPAVPNNSLAFNASQTSAPPVPNNSLAFSSSQTSPPVPNNSLAFNASSSATNFPVVPNNSLVMPPAALQQPVPAPAPAPTPAPVAAPAPAPAPAQPGQMTPAQMMEQMMAMQRNMQMMMQMSQGQQPAPAPVPAPAAEPTTAWGSSTVAPPPPIPEPSPQSAPQSQSNSQPRADEPQNVAVEEPTKEQVPECTPEVPVEEPQAIVEEASPAPASAPADEAPPAPEPTAAQPAQQPAVTMDMMNTMQQQLQQTQELLMKQQQAFMEMQKQFASQQQ